MRTRTVHTSHHRLVGHLGQFGAHLLGLDSLQQSLLDLNLHTNLHTACLADNLGSVLLGDFVVAQRSRLGLVDVAVGEVQVKVERTRSLVIVTDRQHDTFAATHLMHNGFHQVLDDVLIRLLVGEFREVGHFLGEFFVTSHVALLVGGDGLAGSAESLHAVVDLDTILKCSHNLTNLIC